MTPTSIILIGGKYPKKYWNVPCLLISLPGEDLEIQVPTAGGIFTARFDHWTPKTLDECLMHLRCRYSDHQSIASLGGCKIIADHPIEGSDESLEDMAHSNSPAAIRAEWAPAIEQKLCELLDDLGNCPMDSWKGARHIILNGEQIANSPSSRELMYAHAGEPAIVLGSGPSASDYLDAIARIRPGVRIFCADTMLRGCLAKGIVPDYVCAIEREPNITRVLGEDAGCGSILIASPFVEPECLSKWGKNVLFWWGADDIFRWIDPKIEPISSGRSSGTLALAAAAQAGCSTIYLIGHDLSYRNGASHAADAHKIAHSANAKADSEAVETNPLRQRSHVVANHGGTVETNGLWNRIRGDLEGIIANHPNWKVFNVCGHNGARIAGAPVGDLPSMPMRLPAAERLKPSGVRSPLRRVTSLGVSLLLMEERLNAAREMLNNGADLTFISESLQVSRLFGVENASLMHYISRSVVNSLTLRLHIQASNGVDSDTAQRNSIQLLITTMLAICERMKEEMPL